MTTYDVYQKVLQVIDWHSQSYTLTHCCDAAGISIATFEKAVEADPDLQDMFRDAVRRGHDALTDALINIDNHKVHGQSDARMANVISANIKWVLSKADPRRFADRVEVKHEITMDKAIVDALMRAKDRTDFIDITPHTLQIEHVAVEFEEEDDDWMRA